MDEKALGEARKKLDAAIAMINHDAYILGRGTRADDGTMKFESCEISDPHELGVTEEFVERYKKVAKYDVASGMFLSRAFNVLRISVSMYEKLTPEQGGHHGRLVAKVLSGPEGPQIRHILLVGVESTYGRAWVTLYRITDQNAFSVADCERGAFILRGAIFEWQSHFSQTQPEFCTGRYEFVKMRPGALEVAIWRARGCTHESIIKGLRLSPSGVRSRITQAVEALGEDFESKLLGRMLGPLRGSKLEDE